MIPARMLIDSLAHFFSEDLDNPLISENDLNHLVRSLRAREGETITISDGNGSWAQFTIKVNLRDARQAYEAFERGELIERTSSIYRQAPSDEGQIVGVGFSPNSSNLARDIVKQLTEVGVDLIIPILCDHTVLKASTVRNGEFREKLVRVMLAACQQSRRVRLATVLDAMTVDEVIKCYPDKCQMADYQLGSIPNSVSAPNLGSIPNSASEQGSIILVGPEGGWSDRERTLGIPRIGLGPNVLRTETAALIAGSILVKTHKPNFL